ncbi:MAG: glycosyltransferase family 2 protein [Oscillospiraceae bacterium]|nr:glycosyltransferase family 2 protein [Oscillospiraceae bacterium]
MAQKEKLYQQYRKEETAIDPKEVQRLDRPFTIWGKVATTLLVILGIYGIWQFTARADGQFIVLGGLMFVFLMAKHVFGLFYRPCTRALTKDYKVTAIVTCYNENPASVVGIFENILALDYPVHEILFLDDGSADTTAYEVAKSFAEAHGHSAKFQIVRFEENRGKRAVMIDGFQLAEGDYVFMLDSDSEILPNALTELLRPFEDGKTTSVVGNIGILNRQKNFLTRLQSMTYYGAFQLGRAAQSVTGNVVVCSGAFSLHQKAFILAHLEDLASDELFGITVSAGDDRALSSFSRMCGGKTRYQSSAYCETEAPEKLGKFLKQRRRWQRSGYIGSLKTIKDIFPRKPLFLFWTFSEVYFFLIAIILFVISVLARGFYVDIRDIILYFIIVTYINYAYYMLYKPLRFLFAPFHSLLYGLTLLFTRIHAAVTITNDDWGTRQVAEEEQEALEPLGEDVSFAA